MYAKTLAKSVVKKEACKSKSGAVDESRVENTWGGERGVGRKVEVQGQVEEEESNGEAETSLWCGDEEGPEVQEDNEPQEDEESSEEDEDPVQPSRSRRQQASKRRIVVESEEDESEDETKELQASTSQPPSETLQREPAEARVNEELPDLKPMRPPHRKGHSVVSNWAQDVVDLTSSSDAPSSFDLPPPTHMRTASFAASSRPTSSASNGAFAILT